MRQEFKNMVATLVATMAIISSPAFAQSVSSVSGADVKPGDNTIENRIAFSPENDGKDEGFSQRFHFQHSFDGKWRARIIVLQGKRGAEALKTRSVSAEVIHQFLESENTGGWDSAIRVDGEIPTERGRSGRVRAVWLNGFELDDHWHLRANIYIGKEINDYAREGLTLETREELTYRLQSGLRLGAQIFDNFNTTDDVGSFDEEKHAVGPIIKGKLGEHFIYEASALFGVSQAASDADVRLFLAYSF